MSTQKEETRLRLLEAARKLLLKRGFHGVGLEDIAEAAGVSRQAVYKTHFASKAELLLALVQHMDVTEKIDELTKPVREAKTGLAMLEAGIVAIIEIEARVHDVALMLSAAAVSDAGAAAALHDRLEVKRSAIRGALTRIQNEGHFSSSWQLEEALDVLSALVSIDAYQKLVVEGGWKPEALIRRVWEICQLTFLLDPACPAPAKPRRQH